MRKLSFFKFCGKYYFKVIVPGHSSDPPLHREYRGNGDVREVTPNRNYRKQPLLLKSNYHCLPEHTHILLVDLILPKCFVDSAFATKVSYSTGHLTSTL